MTDELKIQQLETKLIEIERLLRKHTHSGIETNGKLEPTFLKLLVVDAISYAASGVAGITGTFQDKNSNTVRVASGIITSLI